MLRKIVVILIMVCIWSVTSYAKDSYPHKSHCPAPGVYIGDNRWGFYQCECTSYVAYKIDDQLSVLSDGAIGFGNKYRQPKQPPGDKNNKKYHWSDGSNWDNAAKRADIKVDQIPIPGDVAYWEDLGGYGHVAFVESVDYDSNMHAKKVHISEYNYKSPGHTYGTRSISPNSPSGYIHILAHQECATSYYFNRMDAPWAFPQQTEEEWQKIFLIVWDRYRGETGSCDGSLGYAFQQLWYVYGGLPSGFGGGTPIGGAYTPPPADYSNPGGATEVPQPGESDHAGYVHNVSMDDVEASIAGHNDYHHSLTFYHREVPTLNVRARLKNKINHKIGAGDVTIKWFESPNKTFNPSYDHHFATDHNKKSIGKFKHHSHSDELVERKTGITYLKNLNPGVYYLYPVFYYNGEDNVASKHDHGEYIKITINPKYDLQLTNVSLSKWQVAVGESFTLSATVKNKFDHLSHDVRVGLYIDGGNYNNKLFYAKVFHPNDLGTKTFSTSILAPLTSGSYAITVKVDDENRTAETSEGNNQWLVNLTVNSSPINGRVDTNYGSTDPNNPLILKKGLNRGYCSQGTPSAISGIGRKHNPWTWTCQGKNGGADEVGYAVIKGLTTAERIHILFN